MARKTIQFAYDNKPYSVSNTGLVYTIRGVDRFNKVFRPLNMGIILGITVTSFWVRWHFKSPASRLFAQPFIQAQTTENTSEWCIPLKKS